MPAAPPAERSRTNDVTAVRFEAWDEPTEPADLTFPPDEAERPSRVRRVGRAVAAAARATGGVTALWAGLSVVAAVPGVGPVLALGWLLEAEGRAATGDGAGRRTLGGLLRVFAVVVGVGAVLWAGTLPVRFAAGLADDAAVITPGGVAAPAWRLIAAGLGVALTLHVCLWLLAGGRTGWCRPLRNLVRLAGDPGGSLDRLGLRAAGWWAELGPLSALWLGVRGVLVGLAWVGVPSVLLTLQGEGVGRGLLRVVGAAWLAGVLPLVPAAQANLAAARHAGPWRSVRAGLTPIAAWRTWRGRPGRWTGVLLLTLAATVPLYLFAVVRVPEDAQFLLTPACLAAVLPCRLLAGWTRRGCHRADPPRWFFALPWLPVGWLVALAYALPLFATQFVAADGPAAVLRQPGVFTPVPF